MNKAKKDRYFLFCFEVGTKALIIKNKIDLFRFKYVCLIKCFVVFCFSRVTNSLLTVKVINI